MTRRLVMTALAVLAACCVLPGAAGAAFIGTNGNFAFESSRNGFPADNDLYTMTAAGGTQTRITTLDLDELNPSWTANGTKLAFDRVNGMRSDIYSANANGTGQVQLTTNVRNDIRPAWKYDGTQIVFASDRDSTEGMFDIFVMSSTGTGQTNITNTPTINEEFPAWSPDGSLIAFSRDGDIYTMSSAGANLVQLTSATTEEIDPDWFPTGGQIVYQVGRSTDGNIWKMNSNGTGQTNLTNNGTLHDEAPVWSPAGDKIAFMRDGFNLAEVYTMNADGTVPTRITNNTVIDSHPSWQPVPLATGTITVQVDAQPDDAQDFSYTAAGAGLSPTSFSLDDDTNATLSHQRVYSNVTPGSGYSFTQGAVPAGWDLSSSTCNDGSPITNVNVSAGEHVTCTFTNKRRGQIIVIEDAQPDDAQDFAFTAGGGLSPTTFSLDDDADGTLSNTRTFTSVVARNAYTLAQTPTPSGWAPASASCSDGSPVTNIDVGPTETVTCTFVSQKQGSVTIVKDAQPNDAQDFAFTAAGGLSPSTFSLDDDSDGTLSNTRAFPNVNAGTYSVSETLPSGWTQSGATCSDGSPITAIAVSAGENVTCTFTNQKQGQIIIIEDATPNDPQDFNFTAGGGLTPTTFTLDDDADPTFSNTRTFPNVPAGSGYCGGPDRPSGMGPGSCVVQRRKPAVEHQRLAGRGRDLHLERCQGRLDHHRQERRSGRRPGLRVHSKQRPVPHELLAGRRRRTPRCPTRASFSNVAVGSGYSVAETVPSGWDQASAICSDGSPVTNISSARASR